MKYDITHTCGHERRIDITGTNVHGERDRKVKYFESCPCPECYAKAQAGDAVETEMSYSEYKTNYSDCKTKPNSYNAKTKTVIVYVPAEANGPTKPETTAEAAIAELIEMGVTKDVATITVNAPEHRFEGSYDMLVDAKANNPEQYAIYVSEGWDVAINYRRTHNITGGGK